MATYPLMSQATNEKGTTMSDYDYFDITTGEGLTDAELHERYDDMLDDISGPVQVGGCEYDASRVLREVDPIAYRVGFSDFLDAENGETITDEPTVHLIDPRGEVACIAGEESEHNASEIDAVTCEDCLEAHELAINED